MVLLVDDDPRTARTLAAQFDHSFLSTTTAEKAITLARQYQPDGVIVDADFATPRPSLLAQLRHDAPLSPLVVLARHASDEQAAVLLRAGAIAYVDCAATGGLRMLIERIARHLRRRLSPDDSIHYRRALFFFVHVMGVLGFDVALARPDGDVFAA